MKNAIVQRQEGFTGLRPAPWGERILQGMGFVLLMVMFAGVSLIFEKGHYRSYVISKTAVLCWSATLLCPFMLMCNLFSACNLRKIWNSVSLAVLLFLICLGMSTILSPRPQIAFYGDYFRCMGFITMMPLCCVPLAVMLFADTELKRTSVLMLCVVLGVLNSLYALAQLLGFDPFRTADELKVLMAAYVGRPVGFSGNADFFGPMIVITSLLTTCKLFETLAEGRWPFCALWAVSLVVQLVGLVLSLTRGSWLAAVGGFLTFVIALLFKFRKKMLLKLSLLTFGVAGVVVGVFFALGWLSPERQQLVLGKLHTIMTLSGYAGLPIERIVLWRDTLAFVVHQWSEGRFTGVGLDCFGRYFMPFQSLELSSIILGAYNDNPHNNYLAMLSMTGIPGALAYAALFGVAVWRLGHALRAEEDFRRIALLAGVLAALVGYGMNLLTIFDTVSTYIIFFVILGLVPALCEIPPGRTVSVTAPKRIAVLLLFLLPMPFLVIGSARLLSLWRADYYFKSGVRSLEQEENPIKAGELIQKAAALCPSEAAYRTKSLEVDLAVLPGLLAAGRAEEVQKVVERARETYRSSEPRINNPGHPRTAMGLIFCEAGRVDEGIGFLEDALRFDRWGYQTHTMLGQLYYAKYAATGEISFLQNAFRHSATSVSVLRNFPYRDRFAMENTLVFGLMYNSKTGERDIVPDLVQTALFFARWDFYKDPAKSGALVKGVERLAVGTAWERLATAASLYSAYRVILEEKTPEAVIVKRRGELIESMRSLGVDKNPCVKDFLDQMGK